MQHNLEFWIDNNLPPKMVAWLQKDFGVSAKSFEELGFQSAGDSKIFKAAAQRINTIVITTKDIDFVNFSSDIGVPPKVLYLNIGNVSDQKLKEIIYKSFKSDPHIFRNR